MPSWATGLLASVWTTGLQPTGRKPGPVDSEQKKWNKVRLEKPRNIDVYTSPYRDSAGGHSMVLQYRVMKVIHLMMPRATMGPQWKTLQTPEAEPMTRFSVWESAAAGNQ